MVESSLTEKLHQARQELLDLGLRNPLLNYRPYALRGLELVDENPADLYRLLVQENQPLTFLPRPGLPASEGLGQPADLPPHYTDHFLQTPYPDPELQKRLLHTHYLAQSIVEEQGVNNLYLALGFLRWSETDNNPILRRAPLVLLPVQLQRASANDRFELSYTGADLATNWSLEAKLRLDFGLQLPHLPAAELDLPAYLTEVTQLLSHKPHWQVENLTAAVAFFSFHKFLLYADLDPANWPENAPLTTHPIIQSLLGPYGFPPAAHPTTPADLDQELHQQKIPLVVDADSSQLEAVLATLKGQSLVIQGPPGTGKSQTITNLIAAALSKNKTVLFVSEKMAALQVVQRRLEAIGLGPAVLELHSHKATKRAVLDELAHTLGLGQPRHDGEWPGRGQLRDLRLLLNTYHRALNTPIGESGRTPHELFGLLTALNEQLTPHALPTLPLPALRHWSAGVWHTRRQLLQTLQDLLVVMGVPQAHPFWGVKLTHLPPHFTERFLPLVQQLWEQFKPFQAAGLALASSLPSLENPPLDQLFHLAERLITAPNLRGLNLTHEVWSWSSHTQRLQEALTAGVKIATLYKQFDPYLIPEAWQQDVFALRQPLMVHGQSWLGFLASEYRQAKQTLLGLCRRELPDTAEEQLALVDAILEVQRLKPQVEALETWWAKLFGFRWEGILQTDWGELNHVAAWVLRLHSEVQAGQYPAGLLAWLEQGFDREALRQAVGHFRPLVEQFLAQFTQLCDLLQATPPAGASLTHYHTQLTRWHSEAERLEQMVQYNQLLAQLPPAELGELEPLLAHWSHPSLLLPWFDQLSYQTWLDRALAEHPILSHELLRSPHTAVEQFQQLDQQWLWSNRQRLAHWHWRRLPTYTGGGQLRVLLTEVQKKRQNLPLRQLLQATNRVIQTVKPVFMMSPLSIAQFLPPAVLQFDLVIFDEASQVRPVDALGAIARGGQTIVVGDSRQLPPTSFFDRVLGAEETAEEEFLDPAGQTESILDLFVQQQAPQTMLRWHYRSRHESLIALSNQLFYAGQLALFPSPDFRRTQVGLRYHHLPHTTYDRGASRTNPLEAQAVAQAVLRHAQTEPHLSLGIATFSTPQRQAIEDEIEQLRRTRPELEPFFASHPTEPFFVKNLENVQGDERDVILISLGYGRTAEGKVSLNFGPLNQTGGERRLNVLITRAKRRCELFTNLLPEDIDLKRTDSAGLQALRAYLLYAQTGQLAELPPDQLAQPNPLVNWLAEKLTAAGQVVDKQVGQAGVTVEMAVRDPENKGYCLGLLTDGARPGRVRTVHDRYRLQEEVLLGLGWYMSRQWSQRWWQDPAGQWAQLQEQLTLAKQGEKRRPPHFFPAVTEIERFAPPERTNRPVQPYERVKLPLPLYPDRPGWIFNKGKGLYIAQHHYRFDPEKKCFGLAHRATITDLAAGRSYESMHLEKYPAGDIYFDLVYNPRTGEFATALPYGRLFTPRHIYWLYFDPAQQQFYGNIQEHTHAHSPKIPLLAYNPQTGESTRTTHYTRPFEHTFHPVPVDDELLLSLREPELRWLEAVLKIEAPLHPEEFERVVAQGMGLTRRSTLSKDVALSLTKLAVHFKQGEVRPDSFLWLPDVTIPPLRSRASLPAASKELNFVTSAEILEGLDVIVQDSFAVRPEELPDLLFALLGFGPLGQTYRARVLALVEEAVQSGRFVLDGEFVRYPAR